MITRRQALAMSSPCLALLVATAAWNAWAYRAELAGRLRNLARI